MYDVEMIWSEDGQVSVDGLPLIGPDLETFEAAIEAGHRLFGSHSAAVDIPGYPAATGFRVKARSSQRILYVWAKAASAT